MSTVSRELEPPPRRTKIVPPWRVRPFQTYVQRRTYANQRTATGRATVSLALVWLIPWERRNYPGVWRGACTLLGKVWHQTTIWGWCNGRTRAPPDVALALAVEIERRCEVGMAIAAQLRCEVDAWRPFDRSHLGFLAVDPETGKNKRWRG